MLTEARHANASFAYNGVSHNRLNFCSIFRIISDCWSLLDSTAPVLKLYINVALARLAPKVEIKYMERSHSDIDSIRLRSLH